MKQIPKTYNSDSKEKLSDDTEWLSQDVDQHFEECQIFCNIMELSPLCLLDLIS